MDGKWLRERETEIEREREREREGGGELLKQYLCIYNNYYSYFDMHYDNHFILITTGIVIIIIDSKRNRKIDITTNRCKDSVLGTEAEKKRRYCF